MILGLTSVDKLGIIEEGVFIREGIEGVKDEFCDYDYDCDYDDYDEDKDKLYCD